MLTWSELFKRVAREKTAEEKKEVEYAMPYDPKQMNSSEKMYSGKPHLSQNHRIILMKNHRPSRCQDLQKKSKYHLQV